MSVRVVSASQAAELDAAAIAGGVPSRSLMQAAGRAAAALVLSRFPLESSRGVAVYAGSGNNGGDAWVVAAELAHQGVRVRMFEASPARTADAIEARERASAVLTHTAPDGSEGVIIDGLLGTGARGAPHGEIADAIGRIDFLRSDDRSDSRGGARIVALDIPSGVDATTGEAPGAHVRAHLTVTFGAMKRGLLVNRDASGAIIVVDIGLGAGAAHSGDAMSLFDRDITRDAVPPILAAAHKGTRKKLLIVGGSRGMAGATILAARGAMRSGIGMVKIAAADESIAAVQASEAAVMCARWPQSDEEFKVLFDWANVLLVGPGLGLGAAPRAFAERVLGEWRGPVVVDADALTAFEGRAAALGALLSGRPAAITPHAVEFARLAGVSPDEVNARRFEIAGELARTVHATVLLKGVPTVVSDGIATDVSASGTPVLATGGSGDVLGGMVATLLAQGSDPRSSAAAAAWVHGRAAEIAGAGHVRGVNLNDVVAALRDAWRLEENIIPAPILAELPAVGESR
jgi:ADP-dependent NAD(P)H-hydrate dehydratase / NAD(P)H-hydrate epimerase